MYEYNPHTHHFVWLPVPEPPPVYYNPVHPGYYPTSPIDPAGHGHWSGQNTVDAIGLATTGAALGAAVYGGNPVSIGIAAGAFGGAIGQAVTNGTISPGTGEPSPGEAPGIGPGPSSDGSGE